MNNHIKKFREIYGVTQQTLAADIGISRQAISNFESGCYTPSLITAYKIARYFGVLIEKIFYALKEK